MGLPALRQEPRSARSRSPRLSVVRSESARPKKRNCSARARLEATRSAFRTFAILAALVSVLAVGRVWLSVEAANTSLEAEQLRAQIKTARYQGDMLEVSQSALGSPSRIRSIATQTMDMVPASHVTYLTLDDTSGTSSGSGTVAETASRRGGASSIIGKVMDLTAGEAQVLLVGDVGLTATK